MVDHLKHVLDSEGIDCEVRNRYVASAAGGLPANECWVELWVLDESKLQAAQRLIERAFDHDDLARAEAWECRRCGERLEPQFEACWKCSTQRGASVDDGVAVDQPISHPAKRKLSVSEMPRWLVFGLIALAVWYVVRSFAKWG